MKKVIHRADSRGIAEHGWLHSRHSFSFADYYNPQRIRFGVLRVLNDDVVEAGAGFGTHSHANMEIVSIPLSGSLRHQDSMGNKHIIRAGEVQIMSAGTGLTHSEYNHSNSEPVNFLQIWVLPRLKNIEPRYDQKSLIEKAGENRFDMLVSPDKEADSLWINQDAWFSLGNFTAGQQVSYDLHDAGHGVYVFVIDGDISIANETLARRDAMALSGEDNIVFQVNKESKILLIEVALQQGDK